MSQIPKGDDDVSCKWRNMAYASLKIYFISFIAPHIIQYDGQISYFLDFGFIYHALVQMAANALYVDSRSISLYLCDGYNR